MTFSASRRALASVVVVALAGAAALCFYLLSVALGAQPAPVAFAGWIGVIQPASNLSSEVQVRVNAQALHGSGVNMAYGVTLCGSGAFSGLFLIGDDARLDKTTLAASSGTARRLPDANLSVLILADGTTERLQSVQVVQLTFDHLPACVSDITSQTYAGTGFRIQGRSQASVVTHAAGMIRGATERWSMPYVGGLPGQGSNLGVFRITGGVQGDFVRPASFAANVDAGPIPIHMDLEHSRPATTNEGRASWYGNGPLQATATVEDTARLASLQRFVAIAAIFLGVFGSMLASTTLEWLRPQVRPIVPLLAQPHAGPGRSRDSAVQLARASKSQRRSTAAWALAVFASYFVGRCRNRHNR